jgi:hypothetical protein
VEKRISLTVNGKPVHFALNIGVYNRYLNELQPTSKVAPAHNLLTRSVEAESKEYLHELLGMPGVGVQLASALITEFTPDVEIELGK